jgi:hypothetical protein
VAEDDELLLELDELEDDEPDDDEPPPTSAPAPIAVSGALRSS